MMHYTFGDCELDTVHQTLHRAGYVVPLEGHVYAVLAYLLRHRHRVVPKDELLHSLWRKTPVYENTLQRCISQARRAIGCNPQTQPFIKTYYGKGYHFHAAVTETPPVDLPPSVAPLRVFPPFENSAGHSQQVTLLCCVIAARPSAVPHVPPAPVRHWHEQVVVAACAQIAQQAGSVLYADETGVLALFGAPGAEAAHAQQALGAALTLRTLGQALPGAGETLHPSESAGAAYHRLQVQVGVHTGQITIWHPPGAPPQGWPVLGAMRALVTHLAQQAGPDTILLSAPTARQVRHLVQLHAVPSLPVLEDTSALPVHQVHRASDLSSPAPADGDHPLVGRMQELAHFHALVARVTAGHGQVVGLLGEPGIGKTRLLAAFQRSLLGDAVTYVEGRCGATASAPLRTLIGQLCGFHPNDPPGQIRETVRQTLQDVGLPPEAGGPHLLELLGGHSGLARSAGPLDAASCQQALATLCQLLVNRSRQCPLIVVGEDLHWCDPLFETFCTLLADQVWDARVLLIGTTRPGLAPAWLTRTAAALLTLTPLGPQDSTRIIQAIREAAPLPTAIQHAIVTKAAGNPLFLTEWTRAMMEAGPVQEPLPVPDTIQDVLRTRIESLPRAAKQLLQAAAVLGPTGPVSLLALLWEEPVAVPPLLAVLVQRAVLTVQPDAGDPQYTFAHTLLQDVAYASLLPSQQQALHTRAAQALEIHYADRLAVVCDALAAHATQALALLEYAPARERDVRGLTLVLQLARAWSFLGRFAETRTLLEQHHATLERCQQPALAGRYYFRLGRTYSLLGEHTRAATTTRHALAAATQAQDAETMGLAHYELARERFLTGPPRDSLTHGQEAVRLLTQIGAQWWLGMAHWAVGVATTLLGAFPSAQHAVAQTAALGDALQDPHLQSYAAFTSGWIDALRGAHLAGITACRRGAALATDPVNTAHALGALGIAYLESGAVDQAVPLLEHAVQQWQRFGLLPLQAWLTALWADAVHARGDASQAQALATRSVSLATAAGFPFAQGLAHRVLGRSASQQGHWAKATAALMDALQTFARIEARFEQGRTHLDIALLAQHRGDLLETTHHLTEATALFHRLQLAAYQTWTAHQAHAWGISLPMLPA